MSGGDEGTVKGPPNMIVNLVNVGKELPPGVSSEESKTTPRIASLNDWGDVGYPEIGRGTK
jgi:hypothetical protein